MLIGTRYKIVLKKRELLLSINTTYKEESVMNSNEYAIATRICEKNNVNIVRKNAT